MGGAESSPKGPAGADPAPHFAIDQGSALPLPVPAGGGWEVVGSDGCDGAAEAWLAAVGTGVARVLQPPVSWLQDESHLSLVLQARPSAADSLAVVWYARPGDGEDVDGDRLASAVDVLFLAGSEGPLSSVAWAAQLAEAASGRNTAARGRAAEALRASSPVLLDVQVAEEGAGGVLGVAATEAAAAAEAAAKVAEPEASDGAMIAYWLRLILPAAVRPAGSSADAASLNACLVARKDCDAIWSSPVDEAAAAELAEWHAQWATPAELVRHAGRIAARTSAGIDGEAAATAVSAAARVDATTATGGGPHRDAAAGVAQSPQGNEAAGQAEVAASPSPGGIGTRRPGAPKPTAAAKALMFELD